MLPGLEEIGRRRRLLSMSQKQLANLAGVSQSMIAKIENKNISPSYLKTKAIFDTLESLERRNEMKAKEICHGKVVSVQAHEQISRAVHLMRETGFSQLPVLNGDRVVGSITEKTLLQKLVSSPKPEVVSKRETETIMDDAFPTVNELTPVSMVSALLQYEPAVLVLRRGHLLGIITKADLLKVIKS
jgi:predicted transcriptional regulator